ncbi:MAG: universal stress protein [Thermodesulfobacteriota bacterium]|nr:universal stress protein [Thermodesulfobacteriota bacterium]
MKIKKVLFPTKFRELAFNSLESLLELKEIGLKEVVLTYVIPRDEVAFVPFGGYMKDEEERLREQARIRFEDWQQSISRRGIDSKIIIKVGNPIPKIMSIAEEEKVDMIVAGRKKRTTLDKVHVGSHTLDLVRRSSVPVLISKYMVLYEWEGELITRLNEHIFRKPLFATDWSKPSEKALKLISSFKGLTDKVMVTHIIGVKIAKNLDKSELRRIERESKERLGGYCDKLKKAGVKAEPHLFSGRSSAEIIRVAREHKATMIVIGTTGKDRIRDFWLGSVSHRVAEMSELPVLLVP